MMKKLTSIMLIGAVISSTIAVSAIAANKHGTNYSQLELNAMDTNKDSMVSKDEFLAYNELAFSKMKLTNGMISLKSKAKTNSKSTDDESSMNNKPIGTTTENPNVNERDAVNGKSY
jgi:hypothetical protein